MEKEAEPLLVPDEVEETKYELIFELFEVVTPDMITNPSLSLDTPKFS